MASGVPTEKILKADLSELQFLRLTLAVARLTDSPLGISMSPEDEHFGERLELARWAPGAEVGICDWILSPAEVRVAQRSELRIIALGIPLLERTKLRSFAASPSVVLAEAFASG